MKTLLITFFSILPFVCFAYDVEVDGIYYNLNHSELTAEVTSELISRYGSSYNATYTGEIVIPSSIAVDGEHYTVNSIGESAFAYSISLTDISIPNSITEIKSWAFNY